ncbi:MAG: hypothetical protein ACQEQW_09060 [Bacteroidota bacterium]
MEYLLKKLNYRDQDRICIINGNNGFIKGINQVRPSLRVDREVDPKYLYSFFLIFIKKESDLRETAPQSIHNLSEDGILWFAYPRQSSKTTDPDINRDKGWDLVSAHGFKPVRQVCIDDKWSALRFRDKRFIKKRKK